MHARVDTDVDGLSSLSADAWAITGDVAAKHNHVSRWVKIIGNGW